MSSLEETLAAAATETSALNQTVRGELSVWQAERAALAAAKNDLSSAISKKLYVDAVNGDDTADGAQGTPLRTVHEAGRRVRSGGHLILNLLTDAVVDNLIATQASWSVNSIDNANPSQLRFTSIGRISFAVCTPLMVFNHVDVEIDSTTQYGGAILFDSSAGNGTVRVNGGSLTATSGSTDVLLSVLGMSQSCTLMVSGPSIKSNMAGRFLLDIAAGTAPSSLPFLNTNLPSL